MKFRSVSPPMSPNLFPLPESVQARGWALFLDVDGTLLDIAPTPDAVVVSCEVVKTLDILMKQLNGAVALISGRGIDTLDTMFAPLRLPTAGVHGILLRKESKQPILSSSAVETLDFLRKCLSSFVTSHPGCLLEDKSVSLAVHYRDASNVDPALRHYINRLLSDNTNDLIALSGKNVIEIKPANVTKGTAVTFFMNSPPFRTRIPVFFGDDDTDQDAFHVVTNRGGYAVHIGPYPQGAAKWSLPNPSSVRCWLCELARRLIDATGMEEVG